MCCRLSADGELLRCRACGGADEDNVVAYRPVGNVEDGGDALAVAVQHLAAVVVVDFHMLQREGGDHRNLVGGRVGEEVCVAVGKGGDALRLGDGEVDGVAPLAVVPTAFALGTDACGVDGVEVQIV